MDIKDYTANVVGYKGKTIVDAGTYYAPYVPLMRDSRVSDWKKCFAWKPTKLIDGSWTWMKHVYMRQKRFRYGDNLVFVPEYGTLFDVLKEKYDG